ncbi:hypothetical protein [Streptomyces sp. NPDC048551]|uniref:hypothetical protein n=1 Tax=Streptomyces sp. NPDC048551 TaxID=3155758 RepID=UPI00343D290C
MVARRLRARRDGPARGAPRRARPGRVLRRDRRGGTYLDPTAAAAAIEAVKNQGKK